MKRMRCQSETVQLLIGDFDGDVVTVRVQGRLDDQAGLRSRVGDQTDNGLVAHQRPPAPVLGNEAEEAVFDSIPLAGARRKVTEVQAQSQFER